MIWTINLFKGHVVFKVEAHSLAKGFWKLGLAVGPWELQGFRGHQGLEGLADPSVSKRVQSTQI